MTTPGLRRVFIYGTLRRGARNAALMRSARFLGAYRTPPLFTLYDLGAYPGAINGGVTSLAGEVYWVSSKLLQRLDSFEELPRLYDRVIMPTRYGPSWIYLLIREPASGSRRITHGDWLRHRSGRRPWGIT